MPRMSDDVERTEGVGVGIRFKTKCKAIKEVFTRVLVLKQGCKCGQNHLFQTSASNCKQWGWKVHEVLERVIEGVQVNTASDIILGDKCSWEVLVPVEAYLKGWSVSRDWKFQGVFDRKSDLSASGFKSTEELVFALLRREEICNKTSECDHRILEVNARIVVETEQDAPMASSLPASASIGDLLPSYAGSPKPLNEKERPWDLS